MCNPAKHITGLWLFLRKKGKSSCFIFGNKGGFNCGPIGDVFHFFCHQNRRFLSGDGVSLPGFHLAWVAWPGKVFMITKKVMSDWRELYKYGR